MLAAALEAEVEEFISSHRHLKDEEGHQKVVRNGYMKEYERWTKRSLENKEYVYVWADGFTAMQGLTTKSCVSL